MEYLEPFHIPNHMLHLKLVMFHLKKGPVQLTIIPPPILHQTTYIQVPACHMHIPICMIRFQGQLLHHLFIPMFPHVLIISVHCLALKSLQHQCSSPPCLISLYHNNHLLRKDKCMVSRADPIPLTPGK